MKSVSTKTCKRVDTRTLDGDINGFLLEVASTHDGWSKFLNKAQVYMTTVLPGKKKGFHLHHKKENQFTCIKGNVAVAVWNGKKISKEFYIGESNFLTIRVPKKHAICFYNFGPKEAYVVNLCSPPYDPNDKEQEDLDLPWDPKR